MLGPEHPRTLLGRIRVAKVYYEHWRLEEADQVVTQAIEVLSEVLGENHLDTITAMCLKSDIHWNQGRYETSAELSEIALDWHLEVLGEDHLWTLQCMHDKAWSLSFTWEHLNEAAQLNDHVIRTTTQCFGRDHPTSLYIRIM